MTLKTAEEILTFMGVNLVGNHYVQEDFVSELLKRDKYSSTRVAIYITLPHANPNFVLKSVISIATLKEVIDWHGESIRLVILIALSKEELKNPEFKKLFSLIHYLSQNPHKLDQLCRTNNVLDILSQMSSYE
ncbi:PTS sugar transporter subunit IIA [Streptococcus catagoni]|uniref:PTS sugar transporter subunit IIA n=2 Tax=Streptococcus catagoni TaxID=2654874 RepID=UPI00140D9A19|nr:PTS sugar transporter subunit IIA [Streptococcus catagoni]